MATVNISDFYALRTGMARQPDGTPATLTVQPLGLLRVLSGRLGACDPFVNLDAPLVVPIPPGDYPVSVTVADVSPEQDGSHFREAYLSVVVAEGDPVMAAAAESDQGVLEAEQFWVVRVDAGTVAFVDADAVAAGMPPDGGNWYEDVFDDDTDQSWFSLMDAQEPLPAGLANIVMPRASAGENVILSHSGWGDGHYPLIATFSAAGQVLGVHIDLGVVGPLEADDLEGPALEGDQQSNTDPRPTPPRGFFARLLGRR